MNLDGSGNSRQEDALKELCECTHAPRRAELIRELKEASWAYHALTDVPSLTNEEKSILVSRIVEGTFASSWANRLMAWLKEYASTHGGKEFLSQHQHSTLMSAFGRSKSTP